MCRRCLAIFLSRRMTRVRVLDMSLPLYPFMPYRTSVYTPACLAHVTLSSVKVAINLICLFSKYITIYLATLSVGEWTVINGIWVSQGAWKGRKDGARTETGLTFGEGEEPTPAVSTRDSSQHHRPGLSHHPHLCVDTLGLRARMGKAPPAVGSLCRVSWGPRTHQTVAHPFLGGCGFSW